MSSIAGFFQPDFIIPKEDSTYQKQIHQMADALKRRGPDETNYYLCENAAFCYGKLNAGVVTHRLPSITMPFCRTYRTNSYVLLWDGYLTNLDKISKNVDISDYFPESPCQENLLLALFLAYGPRFVAQLRGAFAIAIYDEGKKKLYLFRDPLGLCPLYYELTENMLIFASEPKGLLAHEKVSHVVDRAGLCEIFGLGPAHTPGCGIYKNMRELIPGQYLCYFDRQLNLERYHTMRPMEYHDSYLETKEHIAQLLDHSIKTLSNTPLEKASLLSGGLDSSVVTAKLAKLNTSAKPLCTYSFDFAGSKSHFQSNAFQPSLDAPFVTEMANFLKTEHTTLVCGSTEQVSYLSKSVEAHDLPCMADIDSSFLYFCEKIRPSHQVAFTGECADELFCGYPWYHRSDLHSPTLFPWSNSLTPRYSLLNSDFINSISMNEYVENSYKDMCNEFVPDSTLSKDDSHHQQTMYLTMRSFMQTLIDRTDRVAAYNSMSLRVPFADLDLAEYLFSIPYAIKTKNGEVKHLLREYAVGLLPETVRARKKSPYPKTYDTGYEALLAKALLKELADSQSPLHLFLDTKKVLDFCDLSKDYGVPWYGQLMAAPQLMAYYLQIAYWAKHYQINFDLS